MNNSDWADANGAVLPVDLRVESVNRTFDGEGRPVVRDGECTYAVLDYSPFDDPRLPKFEHFDAVRALCIDTWRHQRLCIEEYERRWKMEDRRVD